MDSKRKFKNVRVILGEAWTRVKTAVGSDFLAKDRPWQNFALFTQQKCRPKQDSDQSSQFKHVGYNIHTHKSCIL
jgi:hypothetical protein